MHMLQVIYVQLTTQNALLTKVVDHVQCVLLISVLRNYYKNSLRMVLNTVPH